MSADLIVEDSINVGASLYEPLETTYTTECYVGYDEETMTDLYEECEQSCGSYSYYLNGYVMVGDEKMVCGPLLCWFACARRLVLHCQKIRILPACA